MKRRTYTGPTKSGYVNEYGKENMGRIEPPRPGTDHGQYIYTINWTKCGKTYGSNGSDICQREYPNFQKGARGPRL